MMSEETFFIDGHQISQDELEDILSQPNWYIKLNAAMKFFHYEFQNEESTLEKDYLKIERDRLIYFFSEELKKGNISLGENIEFYFDDERKPIDTVVIHHTSRTSETPLSVMEGIHLLNLYASQFSMEGKSYFGKPIFSGHEKEGKQTFLAYHYIVMPDGSFEQILKDEYIGWHCGNWEYNCKSIAISIHDDLDEKEPTPQAIETVKKLIAKYNPKEILGHREIKPSTTCPGNKFLGENGWKKKLL